MKSKSNEDRLLLAGVKIQPRIGVTPGERRLPQRCQLDATLWGDFAEAAASDELEKAVNYSRVLERIQEVTNSREYNLIETLAYSVAGEILRSFPASKVIIKVRKRPRRLVDTIDYIEVEVEATG